MSVATTDRTGYREDTSSIVAATSIWAERLEAAGRHNLRYGLVLMLLWIGGMKFTAYEAEEISGLVANSPLMSWAYQMLGTRSFSAAVGITELVIAALIATRPYSARISTLGSLLAIGMFLTTLSFMFSTPGVVEPSQGFPILSVAPGQFLQLGDSHPLAKWLSVGTGVAALILTILTDHKTGLLRVVPYSTHLAVDFLAGVVFVAAPFVWGFTGVEAGFYWINAAAVLTVVGLHKPENSPQPAMA